MTRSEAALLMSVREKEATLVDVRLTFATFTYKGESVIQVASPYSAEKPDVVVAYLAIRCSCSRLCTWFRALHAA